MYHSVVDGFNHWLLQLTRVLVYRFDHITPSEYCFMLVVCISVGWLMLRGRN